MGTRTHTLRPRLRIQTRRLPRTRIPTRSCRSMAMGGHCTCALSARRKSGHLVARNVRHSLWGMGELHTPTSPRVEPRSAEHSIEARLEWRVLNLRAYQLARNAVGGNRGHARTTVVCTLLAHRVEHGTHDLHRPTLCRRARLVWLRLLPTRPRRSW